MPCVEKSETAALYERSIDAGESLSQGGGNPREGADCGGKCGDGSANEELHKRGTIMGANADFEERTVVRKEVTADAADRAVVVGRAARRGGRKALGAAGWRDGYNTISEKDGIDGGGKKENKSCGGCEGDEQEGETLPEDDCKEPKGGTRLHLAAVPT